MTYVVDALTFIGSAIYFAVFLILCVIEVALIHLGCTVWLFMRGSTRARSRLEAIQAWLERRAQR